ncbi:trafficking protein particle complex subunit 12-like [Macrobrachium nipponense]|uniref:trafficking protein particle complex subunit 12-like n=1 Tax=Macrobrachium nipponense TaxID=159736 RepID=UPI0030C8C6EE
MSGNPSAGPQNSSLSQYFDQSSSSIFDQISQAAEDVAPGCVNEQLPGGVDTSTQALNQGYGPHTETQQFLDPSSFAPPGNLPKAPLTITSCPPGAQQNNVSNLNITAGGLKTPNNQNVPQQASDFPPGVGNSQLRVAVPVQSSQLTQNAPSILSPGPLTPQFNQGGQKFLHSTPVSSQSTAYPPHSLRPLTPGQPAMMMSMSASMLVTDTSPNASMDMEATTVKFRQASLEETSPMASSQAVQANSGGASLGIVPVTNTLTSVPIGMITPSIPKNQAASLQDPSNDKSNQSESKLYKYFNNKTASPFDNITSPASVGGGNDSAMMNPVYMSPTDNFNISNAIPSPDSFLTPATEQDVFTASLLSSDADRRHDAWIPSESTKQALGAMATNPPGTYFPEKELLTMPGIAIKEDFGDPVKNLVRTYLGEDPAMKRVVLTAASVTQDDRGLRQLIAAGCYHAAVNLTTQLLTVYGQGEGRAGHPSKHTAHSIQLWFTRIALLIKLRRFSLAEVECQYFGDLDAPDLYFEFYPELYGGRKGSMVPFGFRLLVAELPQYLGKHTQALDRLSALQRTCDQIIENLSNGLSEDGSNLEMSTNMRDDSLKLWKTRRLRVIYSITNCAVSLKDFRLAGGLLEQLIEEDPNSAAGLYSALGRLCLQLGDVTAAQDTFNQYLEHTSPPPNHDPVQGLLHSAYISIAQNAFKDATEILQQAHKINPNNGLVINNLGVCLMYTGRVSDAIKLVEGAVFSQPERFLHEAVVLNLATMYELESSNAHQNKLKLLSLIAQHKGDSFNVAALKLQPQ